MSKPIVLITGAATGFGYALSKELANQGGTLILLDKNRRELEYLYDEINPIEGCEPALYPMNLAGASLDDFITLSNTIEKELGGLDVIIHNAAHFTGLTPQSHVKVMNWIETIQTNLNAPFFINQTCMPLLRKSKDARILFIGDQFDDTLAYRGAYAVSKTALTTYMRVLAEETEQDKNFCVCSFNPGFMETAFLSRIYPGHREGSLPPIENVAKECLQLLTAPREEIHGTTIQTTQGCLTMA